jgi:hypothetical protein
VTGDELVRLELGDRIHDAAICENAITIDERPMRWASHMLTGNADYVSTLAIYAGCPVRLDGGPAPAARYQRRYLIDGQVRRGLR